MEALVFVTSSFKFCNFLIDDFDALKICKFLKEATSCCFFCKKYILANQDTLSEESFNYIENIGNLLEYPQYTRPVSWRGRDVPEILLSGNHKLIREWRLKKAIEITKHCRPDLLLKN